MRHHTKKVLYKPKNKKHSKKPKYLKKTKHSKKQKTRKLYRCLRCNKIVRGGKKSIEHVKVINICPDYGLRIIFLFYTHL